MKTWDAASSRIRRRSVDVWRDLRVETPFVYDHRDPDSYLSSFLVENPPDDPDIVLERLDRDRLWTAEVIITSQKFLHVLRLTAARARGGHITWAATDAHHAVLLGARCFLATLGVGVCQGKQRAHLIDFRPERGRPQDEAAFRKAHRGVENPLRIFTPKTQEMGQKQIFELFNRMLGLVDHQAGSEALVDALKQLKLGAHKSERNRLLYHSDHWHWPEDLNWPAIEMSVKDEIPLGAEGLTRDFFALSLVTDIVFQSIKPLSSKLLIQQTFFEPLTADDLCVSDALSFLTV